MTKGQTEKCPPSGRSRMSTLGTPKVINVTLLPHWKIITPEKQVSRGFDGGGPKRSSSTKIKDRDCNITGCQALLAIDQQKSDGNSWLAACRQ